MFLCSGFPVIVIDKSGLKPIAAFLIISLLSSLVRCCTISENCCRRESSWELTSFARVVVGCDTSTNAPTNDTGEDVEALTILATGEAFSMTGRGVASDVDTVSAVVDDSELGLKGTVFSPGPLSLSLSASARLFLRLLMNRLTNLLTRLSGSFHVGCSFSIFLVTPLALTGP